MAETEFYHAFEAAFRGSREEIIERLLVYKPFLEPLLETQSTREALDLGCGRGEWLQVLKTFGFSPLGVDLDARMLADCLAQNLPVRQQDALKTLRDARAESQAIISSFHMVEHIPFEALQYLISEAMRVLIPGGLLILETPNSENIEVGTVTFHNDHTHRAPIPPNVLRFLTEHEGFVRSKIVRLNEVCCGGEESVCLHDVLFGASPDYAVIAQKNGPANLLERFDGVFLESLGCSTRDLAKKFDAINNQRIASLEREIEVLRGLPERRGIRGLIAKVRGSKAL